MLIGSKSSRLKASFGICGHGFSCPQSCSFSPTFQHHVKESTTHKMVLINFILSIAVAAAVAVTPTADPRISSIPEFERNSDIAKTGLNCDCQDPNDAKLRIKRHWISPVDLYHAIAYEPGVLGVKVPYTPVAKATGGPSLKYWTMEWVPKNTNYKTVTIRWAVNSWNYVFFQEAFTTVVMPIFP